MSGTSVDAIDASLIVINGAKDELLLHEQFPFEKSLRDRILSLVQNPETRLDKFARLHHEIGEAFGKAAELTIRSALKKRLLKSRKKIAAIGFHGQTIFHDPEEKRSLQIGEAALISARTGITTVSDFRSGDTALGGEGAPLLPFYHRRLFGSQARSGIAIHNLGGISNFTYIGPKSRIFALDTGPANCLLDGAIQVISSDKYAFDENGAIAALGRLSIELLSSLKNRPEIEAFRKKSSPKSTGRELFSPQMLQEVMRDHSHLRVEDTLFTLTQFTVDLILESYEREIFKKRLPLKKVVFAGGGARNGFLLSQLHKAMPKVEFATMEDYGWNSQALESQAFAFYAWKALKGEPITFPSTTGTKKPAICGKVSFAP